VLHSRSGVYPSGDPWAETHVYVRRSLRDRDRQHLALALPGVAQPHTMVDVDFSPRPRTDDASE
jgi:hypothetical protein